MSVLLLTLSVWALCMFINVMIFIYIWKKAGYRNPSDTDIYDMLWKSSFGPLTTFGLLISFVIDAIVKEIKKRINGA